ncbi:SRPBCC family protein [Cellulomonas shaoxiangyii]|uniref:SRPBCC family protein n=1 Tax=Cellulomonas shaoxiangyii TaxID=2566013 RepID=A0A4P7SK87_9CELL|nr:SRPBCC family protein [Cellulomonas shaoxiangyii]QCB93877.1 SRPBCC family protein [Cellulomonas shaoxiangyii]TGY83211.1 SRPBCC family protein [Cellulomonas shaoxiangyii]
MTRSTDDVRGVLTARSDGVEVRFDRWYPTTPQDLWAAVTEPARVARWLGPLYGDLRVGGAYELRMGDDVPGADDTATGEVLVCEPPRALAVTWVFPNETVTRVDVELAVDGAGTLLRLRHTGLADDAARGYGGGWHACLDQLDDHVAGRPVRAWDVVYAAAAPAYADARPGEPA